MCDINIQSLYHPVLTHFRAERMKQFYAELGVTEATKILDVGGAPWNWMIAADNGLPKPQITILNIFPEHRQLPPNMTWIVGNGCDMPFKNGEFDIVFSNSVIEHLSSMAAQQKFAIEIRRTGKDYWVQTPDPRFPVEPHYLSPFVHWLPSKTRRRLIRHGSLFGLMTKPSQERIDAMVAEIQLVPKWAFQLLFPDGKITTERFMGIPKSLVARRRCSAAV